VWRFQRHAGVTLSGIFLIAVFSIVIEGSRMAAAEFFGAAG